MEKYKSGSKPPTRKLHLLFSHQMTNLSIMTIQVTIHTATRDQGVESPASFADPSTSLHLFLEHFLSERITIVGGSI